VAHEERVEIANEIAAAILREHGEAIVAIAIYGSVAKNEDGEHSDLEMWVATHPDFPRRELLYVYRGIPVEVSYSPADKFLEAAGRVSPEWAIEADAYNSYVVLHDRGNFVERLKAAASDLPEAGFSEAIRTRMVMTYETAGKLKNAWARGDSYGVTAHEQRLAWSTAMLLGLINRRYYPSGRGFYQLSRQMERKPKDYDRLLDLAGGFTPAGREDTYRAALELWDNLQELLGDLGIEWREERLQV
jgi:kanamycin nucleotidyltransferase